MAMPARLLARRRLHDGASRLSASLLLSSTPCASVRIFAHPLRLSSTGIDPAFGHLSPHPRRVATTRTLSLTHFLLHRRVFSDHHRSGSSPNHSAPVTSDETSSAKPIAKTIEAAREGSKAVRDTVRSSITGIARPHENIYNIPNLLTVSRLLAAPATAYLLLHGQHKWALALFAYAGITDLVDGWMARRFRLQTVAGSVLDPMADKGLMIGLTVTLAISGAIPPYLATLILGRDASLALAAIYYRYASLPAPKTFRRYWDFSLPSAEVHPTPVSKANTFLQLLLIGSTLALPVVTAGGAHAGLLGISDASLHSFMAAFRALVAGTTAWSGLSYAFLPRAVTILGPDEALKAKQGARGRAIIGLSFTAVLLLAARFALSSEDDDADADAEGGDDKVDGKAVGPVSSQPT